VPTVADRVAQTVVARRFEAKVEPIFHANSYVWVPNRSSMSCDVGIFVDQSAAEVVASQVQPGSTAFLRTFEGWSLTLGLRLWGMGGGPVCPAFPR
jgi:hypothetical protein